jgi:predicted nuclease of predicted toxin-antitoxin system
VKLLFDENLSFRLAVALKDLYPDSSHVRDVKLLGAPDEQIWNYARDEDFILVSKDTDFYQRSIVFGAPPKVIWLRIGNANGRAAIKLLRDSYLLVRRFIDDPDAGFLVLSQT